jgi:hypothetical protein
MTGIEVRAVKTSDWLILLLVQARLKVQTSAMDTFMNSRAGIHG